MIKELSVAPTIAVIEGIMERSPKEGYMASVVLGVLEAIKEILNDIESARRKIECIAASKDTCKQALCDPKCGGLLKIESGNGVVIVKHKNNPFSIRISDGRVEIINRRAKVTLDRNTLNIVLQSSEGGESIDIDLSEFESVYKNVYTIKYALKTIIGPLRKAIYTLNSCAKAQALVC